MQGMIVDWIAHNAASLVPRSRPICVSDTHASRTSRLATCLSMPWVHGEGYETDARDQHLSSGVCGWAR
jgi:hypothetical protein